MTNRLTKDAVLAALPSNTFMTETDLLQQLRTKGFDGPPTELTMVLGELDTENLVICEKFSRGRYRSYKRVA